MLSTHFLPIEFGGFDNLLSFHILSLSVQVDSVSADIKLPKTLWVSCIYHPVRQETFLQAYPRLSHVYLASADQMRGSRSHIINLFKETFL